MTRRHTDGPRPSSLPGRPRAASPPPRSRLPSACAARSSTPIPCRSIASFASSRRGRRRPTWRARRTAFTARSRRPRPIPSGVGSRMPPRAIGEARRRGEGADPGRRHRPLFQGAHRGACPGPRHSAGNPRVLARAGGERSAPKTSIASLPRAIRPWRRGSGPTDPQRLVRALEVIDATGVSLAEWQGASAAPVLAPRERAEARHRARARGALCGDRCALRRA